MKIVDRSSSSIASKEGGGEKIPHIEIATNQDTTQIKASKLGDIESETGILFKEDKEEDRSQISSSLRSSLRQRLTQMEIEPEQKSLWPQGKVQDEFRFPFQEEIVDDNEHSDENNIERIQRLHDQLKIKRMYKEKYTEYKKKMQRQMHERKELQVQINNYFDIDDEKKLKDLEQRIKLTRTRAKKFKAKASDIKVLESEIHNLSTLIEAEDRIQLSSSLRQLLTEDNIGTGNTGIEEEEDRMQLSSSLSELTNLENRADPFPTLTPGQVKRSWIDEYVYTEALPCILLFIDFVPLLILSIFRVRVSIFPLVFTSFFLLLGTMFAAVNFNIEDVSAMHMAFILCNHDERRLCIRHYFCFM